MDIVKSDALKFIQEVTKKYGIDIPQNDMRLGDDLCQIDYSNKQVLKKEAFGFRLDSNFISKRIDQISEVQKKMDDILPKALLTESKIQIIKDHGCKSWLMVVGEHDHARDGAIVLGKRLEKVGLEELQKTTNPLANPLTNPLTNPHKAILLQVDFLHLSSH